MNARFWFHGVIVFVAEKYRSCRISNFGERIRENGGWQKRAEVGLWMIHATMACVLWLQSVASSIVVLGRRDCLTTLTVIGGAIVSLVRAHRNMVNRGVSVVPVKPAKLARLPEGRTVSEL